MAMGGVEAAVQPTPHALPWIVSGETLIRMWEDFLDYWVSYCDVRGVDLYTTLGVPFTGVDGEGTKECLKQLHKYVENKRVVGIGEIGLNQGTDNEMNLFKSQLNIAKEYNLPVVVHTPTPRESQAPEVVNQIIDIINTEGFPMEMVILDHTGISTLEIRLETKAMVALSVCYDKNTPDNAARIVQENPDKRDRLLINSELGYDREGYFSVPRAVLAMKLLKIDPNEIEKIVWNNPKNFFSLPLQ
jgi:predicted metal-dependent TIM-barrel fold hydrolase